MSQEFRSSGVRSSGVQEFRRKEEGGRRKEFRRKKEEGRKTVTNDN